MTDVINGKNRKQDASYKVVLPIFTQRVSVSTGCLYRKNSFLQHEERYGDLFRSTSYRLLKNIALLQPER
jgi:hypothetical protein